MTEDLEMKLLDAGNLYLVEPVSDMTSLRLLKQMDYLLSLKMTEAKLYINSQGGEVSDAIAIIDKILYCEKNGLTITGIGIGEAFSSAAIILGMCPHRLISENSSMTLHYVTVEIPSDYADNQSKYMNFTNDSYNALILKLAARCGYSSKRKIDQFTLNVKNSWYLLADQAVKAGIVDGIWNSNEEE